MPDRLPHMWAVAPVSKTIDNGLGVTAGGEHGPKTIRTFPLGPFWRHAFF